MEPKNKKAAESRDKEWEKPADGTKPADHRDKEQLVRLYKEAKRRKDNLTDNQPTQPNNNTNL